MRRGDAEHASIPRAELCAVCDTPFRAQRVRGVLLAELLRDPGW